MYKVIKLFADLEDKNHVYNPGEVYPRAGVVADEERIKELSGSDNKRGEPLIALIAESSGDTEKPKKSAKKNAEK
jgi:hypothetical protein